MGLLSLFNNSVCPNFLQLNLPFFSEIMLIECGSDFLNGLVKQMINGGTLCLYVRQGVILLF